MSVVDASVILSAILPNEPHHQASKKWLTNRIHAEEYILAPTILLSEVSAPLSRAYKQSELAIQIVQNLIVAPFIQLQPVSIPLGSRAAAIAAEFEIRGCDAVYVALAEASGEMLVTLDKQQMARAKSIIQVQRPA